MITKDTKTTEIPEGYELTERINANDRSITLVFEKKQEKNFDWYTDNYFIDSDFANYLEDHYCNYIKKCITNKEYNNIPREIKLGLLMFICDDYFVKYSDEDSNHVTFILTDIRENQLSNPMHRSTEIIFEICPKEFLESIFE